MKHLNVVRYWAVAAFAAVTVLQVGAIAAAEEKEEAKVVIPASASGIWNAIDEHMKMLDTLVAAGTLKDVHEHAYAVRDLVRALPAHSGELTQEARTHVTAGRKFVDTLAARLDETGDANDKAGTVANLQKLKGVLKALRVQYPHSNKESPAH